MLTCTSSCMTLSSKVVRVRVKSGLSATMLAVTEAFMVFSMIDMRSADNDDDSASLFSKFVVSEFSSLADTTGRSIVLSEPGTDAAVVTGVLGTIRIGVEPTTVSLLKTTVLSLGCETVSDVSLSKPSMDSWVFEPSKLLYFFFRRSCRFFFSSSSKNKYL